MSASRSQPTSRSPAVHRAHHAGGAVGVALVKVGTGHAPAGHLTPAFSWLNPFHISSFSAFASGIILMVFIYWGWDTAVAVNEETKDRNRTPGLAAIFSTVILLVTYALVIFSMQSFAGVKTTGNGLGNLANAGDVLSVQGGAIFGTGGVGSVFYRLLLLMVLSSAAASTQTTILPTARPRCRWPRTRRCRSHWPRFTPGS